MSLQLPKIPQIQTQGSRSTNKRKRNLNKSQKTDTRNDTSYSTISGTKRRRTNSDKSLKVGFYCKNLNTI